MVYMICFNCGIKLRTGNETECPVCGVKFSVKCPCCQYPNPFAARFCFYCGKQITGTSIKSSVQNFNTLAESRKKVAVIFADISGFTALSEKMDPEEVREIINECFNYITRPIYELEGTIDKFIGDCVMILFGAKYYHKDDCIRAVTCAVQMLKHIEEFSKEKLADKDLKLTLSIGINFGVVVTGGVGNFFDIDYTVIGDTVNTAQRLQTAADKGAILVSQSVYHETKEFFEYSSPEDIMVKNKEMPVKCYKVLSAKEKSNTEKMKFFARDREINELYSMLNYSTATRCINIFGETGIGKTTLIRCFVNTLGEDFKVYWLECSSRYQMKPNYVVTNLLFHIMNINQEDSNYVKKNRLVSYLDYILVDFDDEEKQKSAGFLSLIMGLERNTDFQNILNSMDYDDIRHEKMRQLNMFFFYYCRKYHPVFIIDDFEWSDSESAQLLKNLVNSIDNLDAAFIFISNKKNVDLNNMNNTKCNFMEVMKLGESGITDIILHSLNCKKIDGHMLKKIIECTDGNILYLKEFLTVLKRNNAYSIKGNTAYFDSNVLSLLPKTIESIIMTNLSDCDQDETEFLQVASVVGKDFNLLHVAELANCQEDKITAILDKAIQMNIITLKATRTFLGKIEKTYTFNQDVIRQVIYNGILTRNKKELHLKIAELIEKKYYKDLESYYEDLCIHYEMAGLTRKASEYNYKTAIKYKNDFSYVNSLEYFRKYLSLIEQTNIETNEPKFVHALIEMGQLYTILVDFDNALDFFNKALKLSGMSEDIYTIKLSICYIYKEKGLYKEALEIIKEIEHRIRESSSAYGRLLQLKCDIMRFMGDPCVLNFAIESEETLKKLKDYESLSEIMRIAAFMFFSKGDMDSASYYLKKAYNYAETINNLRGMARISGNIGIIYHATGMISKALEFLTKSIELSNKISNIPGYIAANLNLGILYMEKGLFNKAYVMFTEALQDSHQIDLKFQNCVALINLGDVMYERGNFEEAGMYYNQSLIAAKELGLIVEEAISELGLSRLYIKTKRLNDVPELLEKSLKIFTQADEVSYVSDYYRYMSLYELWGNNFENAMENIEQSISYALQSKRDFILLKALRMKGIILFCTGKYIESIELYGESIKLAEQLESDYEAAKGYYRRFLAHKKLQMFEEAERDLISSKTAISKVDECRWSRMIETMGN